MRYFFVILFCAGLFARVAAQQPGHALTVQVAGYHDSLLYLGNYYGSQTYVLDSARMDGQGTAVFRGDTALPGGIYFILLPGKQRYFEFLLDRQQHFRIQADTAGGRLQTRFSGSPDNEWFAEYNRFLQKQQAALRNLPADSVQRQRLSQDAFRQIRAYRQQFAKAHPGTLMAALFRAMQDPAQEAGDGAAGDRGAAGHDSTARYRYLRAHYWDGVAFSDSRLVHTPILETRLEHYFRRLVPAQPDTINAEADRLLARAKASPEVFKFTLWWLSRTFGNSPYMGMDAVFVHLVEQYYMTGQATWLDQEQTRKLVDRAARIAPNLIGNKAPDLLLTGLDGKTVKLWDMPSRYTLLVFWDPDCSHCQQEVPRLDSAWRTSWRQKGVGMLGVLTGDDPAAWKKFIETHHLEGWTHARDPDNRTGYRRLYDVYMTPVVYLLNADKKIIAKRLGVDELARVLADEP
ncbi:redoxin domain-containing protein [Compostibacter hankyongensis]|uniref:Thioredoxin domain-containing protein n=1 Tax=Compostibacter hankyongensis TaxID=1007089 RepID=A0ABP8G4Q6_9BACT